MNALNVSQRNKLSDDDQRYLAENAMAACVIFVYKDRCVTGGVWDIRMSDSGNAGYGCWIEWSLNGTGPETRRQLHCLEFDAWDMTRDCSTFRFRHVNNSDKLNIDAPTDAEWVFVVCHDV